MTCQAPVRIENLGFSIGSQQILEDITCSFATGQIHGIIGPNGAGKSTLLRNICRIWEPKQGQILIDDRDHRKIDRRSLSKQVTLVPQETRVEFSIRVSDFVAMGRHAHLKRLQWLGRKDEAIIDNALMITQTTQFRERLINELSGGECQLVSIARALATEAPIILLDEPTSALDIRHKLEIMKLLTSLRDDGKTILMNMHDLDLARRFSDTITMIRSGRIFYHGSVCHAFSKENIQEVFDVHVEEGHTSQGVSLLFY
jgi:iron complex transport system ATP-binding protein